ncbi:sulfotransferase family protein [Amylibacter sp. SFDW26]|uniref:sulfotransferase family protein n=1 Tax=Amylibacter sp. SFDW26 TaxID=2652722 RepID=UPI001261EE26|nr:sulfotransferase family protein [Amylibacter sp. SFDW26]KAB7610056.1 sulfotransferase family protein [Amylibacter sp. SFDW26]
MPAETKPHIILIGFPKSGTSTIHNALIKSGITAAHWMVDDKPVGKLIYDGWFETGDPFHHFSGIEAITQLDFCNHPIKGAPLLSLWPNLDISLLIAIRKMYPKCKFILNYRLPAKTANSISRWHNLQDRITKSDCPGLPIGRGTSDEIERWITSHVEAIKYVFNGDKYFLNLDITSDNARAELEGFLGREIVWWGVANKNKRR